MSNINTHTIFAALRADSLKIDHGPYSDGNADQGANNFFGPHDH